jgi:hypothetical protein
MLFVVKCSTPSGFIAHKMLPSSDLRQITFSKVNDTSLDQDMVTG